MHDRIRGPRATVAVLCAALVAVSLAACGGGGSGGSGTAASLLKQTFAGSHQVKSGNLAFTVTLNPSGSSTLTSPVVLSFGGPFQSRGSGRLPQSNFQISITEQGHTGRIGILSTGTTGFVTLAGTSYQLPAASFQKLESSFAQLTTSAGTSSGSSPGSSALSKLGIHPLTWLINPSVVGAESVAGASTTHVRASVNVAVLLGDFSKFLQKASSLGVSGAGQIPTSLSPATQSRIAGEVQSPRFDVWTGNTDKTVRRLQVALTVPVTGQISTLLGGLSSARVGLSMQYANLNQPQTIQAPAKVRPYSEFSAKLRSFMSSIRGGLASGATGTTATGATGSAATGATGTAAAGAASTAAPQSYGACIQAAGQNVAAMQKCAPLLGK
ncbi:MAG: hypothetical protein M3Z06_06385 [Actinomycetota bacterium]|nr:hypothetical protein [Actinomycetota bacterium]